jgi:hypothetical protein
MVKLLRIILIKVFVSVVYTFANIGFQKEQFFNYLNGCLYLTCYQCHMFEKIKGIIQFI